MKSMTFEPHAMSVQTLEKAEAVREAAADLEAVIALRCPPSREKSLAMTKLEECAMWANKALALHGRWDGE